MQIWLARIDLCDELTIDDVICGYVFYLCDVTCPELQLKIDDMICTILLVMCRYLNIVETQAEGFFLPWGT